MKRCLSVLIRDLKDQRVSPMTNVTDIYLTPDLKYCKVYVSVLGGEEEMARTLEGLKSAAGFLRNGLAEAVNLRNTPELTFVADRSAAYGARMDELIREVNEADRTRPVGKPVNENNEYSDEEKDEDF